MRRCDVYDVLHVENYAALCIAICREELTTVEDAFILYEDGSLRRQGSRKQPVTETVGYWRVADILSLRAEGYKWHEIGRMLGLKAPQSYVVHRKKLVEEVRRRNDRTS